MDFRELCVHLKQRLAMPLPGEKAHDIFRATPVGDVRPLFDHQGPPRPGGVIVLLYEDQGIIKFPLIKRPEYIGHHGGQVSLPGGKAEPGEDAIQTALRECEEEFGFRPEGDPIELGEIRQKSGKNVIAWAIEADFDPATLHDWPEAGAELAQLTAEWDSPAQGRADKRMEPTRQSLRGIVSLGARLIRGR